MREYNEGVVGNLQYSNPMARTMDHVEQGQEISIITPQFVC